jgi:hypothetical protein
MAWVKKDRRNSASWVSDGQKYAVIAVSVKLDDPVPLQEMTPHHWAFADARFDMPAHGREWLGTIRTEEVEASNLFPVCTENLIRVDDVMESPKLAE